MQKRTGLTVEIQERKDTGVFVFDTSKDGVSPIKITYRFGQDSIVLSDIADLVNKYPNYLLLATASALITLGGDIDEEIPSYAKLSWTEWKELHGGKFFLGGRFTWLQQLFLWPEWLILAILAGLAIWLWR